MQISESTFARHIKKIKDKYTNKKILLCGINNNLKKILQTYDLSNLDIIGITDFSLKPAQNETYSWGGGALLQ